MVSRITVVSRYNVNPPVNEKYNREVARGPLYDAADVLNLLKNANAVQFWTRKCKNDLRTLSLEDQAKVGDLLRDAITSGDYRKSEWCVQRPDGPWAACDVYRVKRKETIETRDKEIELEYYLKFAIAKTGTAILLASCHL